MTPAQPGERTLAQRRKGAEKRRRKEQRNEANATEAAET
jgi:hypothetical protein